MNLKDCKAMENKIIEKITGKQFSIHIHNHSLTLEFKYILDGVESSVDIDLLKENEEDLSKTISNLKEIIRKQQIEIKSYKDESIENRSMVEETRRALKNIEERMNKLIESEVKHIFEGLEDKIKQLKEADNQNTEEIRRLNNIFNEKDQTFRKIKEENDRKFNEIERNQEEKYAAIDSRVDRLCDDLSKSSEVNEKNFIDLDHKNNEVKQGNDLKFDKINDKFESIKKEIDNIVVKKIEEFNDKLDNIDNKFDNIDLDEIIVKNKNKRIEINERILKESLCYPERDFVCSWIDPYKIFKLNLLYDSNKDGFKAATFHSLCDGKGATITFIESTLGFRFGGYTTVSWDQSGNSKSDANSFIFSLSHKRKFKVTNTQNSIYCYKDYGPIIGGGHDIYISNDCNLNTSSGSNFGHSYSKEEIQDPKTYLAGANNFTVKRIEVYQVTD